MDVFVLIDKICVEALRNIRIIFRGFYCLVILWLIEYYVLFLRSDVYKYG